MRPALQGPGDALDPAGRQRRIHADDPTGDDDGRFHPRCPLRAEGADASRCESVEPGVLSADAVGAAWHFATT